ncbi:MAG TPA: ROK family transcriptional regulator [Caldilineaceae bacterium]|nr:ROK family transcriptional regulator [Caldilineaceae bacterium]
MLITVGKATHAQTRRHNNRLVLQTVYDQSPLSRADVARATNLTATTVSTVVGELLEEGLIQELGAVSTDRGKPPTLISLNKDARHIIALDLSRKIFQGSILNLRGEILLQRYIPLENRSGKEALAVVHTLLQDLLQESTTPLLGIGIGAPGIIDPNNSVIRQAANLGWYNLELGDLLSQEYGQNVQVVNDTQAILLAENLFGTYKNSSDMVVIRIGNGIGAAIMCNGQLLHGNGSGVGEIGHVVVVDGGERCSCGNDGCLETVASSRALIRQAKQLARSHPGSALHQLTTDIDAITLETVVEAFRLGDPLVTPLVTQVGYHLGSAIAHLISVVGTPRILLCGGLTEFGKPFMDVIRFEARRRCLTGRLTEPEICPVTLTTNLSDLVVMGAAATLLANELGLFW